MEGTLLRAFLVVLSLTTCPRHRPGVEDVAVQNLEGKLPTGEEELHRQTAPAEEETALGGGGGDVRNVLPDQPVGEKDTLSCGRDAANRGRPWWGLSQKDDEIECGPKTLQVTGKWNTNRIQTDKDETTELSHVYASASENETAEDDAAEWEDLLWYIYNMFSVISVLGFLRKYRETKPRNNQKNFPAPCTVADVPLPDVKVLQTFHAKCSRTASEKEKWEGEFLRGFVNDLLDVMRNVSGENGGVVIQGFQEIDRREIVVPFTLPEPYSLQCFVCSDQAAAKIKVVEKIQNQNSCPCQSSEDDDDNDMVCLLHADNEKVKTKTVDACGSPFCFQNTPFLSKSQISRWFQSTIKQAWGRISHKYEFEMEFRSVDVLAIRFRSGKKLSFKMKPVVKNNDAHLSITPWTSDGPDYLWTLSLTAYEEQVLKHFSKQLPKDSCHLQVLETALFLHRRQKVFTGSSTLKKFHFKTAFLQLLLSKRPAAWRPGNAASRLRDVLGLIEAGLDKKQLNHALVGNPSAVIQLPAELAKAKPVNLFRPLAAHDCMHKDAEEHFQEMLKNARIVIEDYAQVGALDRPPKDA